MKRVAFIFAVVCLSTNLLCAQSEVVFKNGSSFKATKLAFARDSIFLELKSNQVLIYNKSEIKLIVTQEGKILKHPKIDDLISTTEEINYFIPFLKKNKEKIEKKTIEKEPPYYINDTLFTTSGYNIVIGQNVKIGTGSTPDGDFKFIRISSSSIFQYYSPSGNKLAANSANAFPRRESGLNYEIIDIVTKGNTKSGYSYYAKIKLRNAVVNYEIDIENAIASGEIVVPDEFKPKPKTTIIEIKQQVSIADEILKLKKLYDDGILSKDEFDAQKKKMLNTN